MKTPEKIKRGLECCFVDDEDNCVCEPRPYARCGSSTLTCDVEMGADARAYIQQLEQDNAQKEERIRKLELRLGDAVAMLRRFDCLTCYHSNMKHLASVCSTCVNHNKWSWRGVEEDDE